MMDWKIEEKKYDEELRENGVDKILKYGIACYMKRCKVKLADSLYVPKQSGDKKAELHSYSSAFLSPDL